MGYDVVKVWGIPSPGRSPGQIDDVWQWVVRELVVYLLWSWQGQVLFTAWSRVLPGRGGCFLLRGLLPSINQAE